MEELARTLGDTNAGDRLLAAREARRRVRVALQRSQSHDDVQRWESLQVLQDADLFLAPACIHALQVANTAAVCAVVLGRLETAAAEAPLQALVEAGGRGQRQAAAALLRVRAAQATAS